jgi:hypothetical protein
VVFLVVTVWWIDTNVLEEYASSIFGVALYEDEFFRYTATRENSKISGNVPLLRIQLQLTQYLE